MSISNKALLANLRISQWVGRKLDKQATATVETEHRTTKKVGQYTKKLLPGAEELETVGRLANGIRQWFYDQTLPWCTDGSRILSMTNYMQFCQDFNLKKGQFDQALQDFMREYPQLKAAAAAKLGDLYREGDYPTEAYLRSAFACEVHFMPVPDVQDFRTEITQSEREAFQKRMQETEQAAMRECWQRLYTVVSKAADKLREPDAIFRDSLISNVQAMCELLPRLNVAGDASLEAMRLDVERLLYTAEPEVLRTSAPERGAVAAKLADIQSKMSVFMGA